MGYCLSSTGKYDEARPWFERGVEAKQKGDVHGRLDHNELGRSLQTVGSCLSNTGKYEEARPWFERAVKVAQRGNIHGRVDHASLGLSLREGARCPRALREVALADDWERKAAGLDASARADRGRRS